MLLLADAQTKPERLMCCQEWSPAKKMNHAGPTPQLYQYYKRSWTHETKIAQAFMHYALMEKHQHKREKSDFPYLYTLTNLCKTSESFIAMPKKG
jgi:hypothetical protein